MYWDDDGWSLVRVRAAEVEPDCREISPQEQVLVSLLKQQLQDESMIRGLRKRPLPFGSRQIEIVEVELDRCLLSEYWGGQYKNAWAFFLYDESAAQPLTAIDWTSSQNWSDSVSCNRTDAFKADLLEGLRRNSVADANISEDSIRKDVAEYLRFQCSFHAPGAKRGNPSAIGSPFLLCPVTFSDENAGSSKDDVHRLARPSNTRLARSNKHITDIDTYISEEAKLQSYRDDRVKITVNNYDAAVGNSLNFKSRTMDWSRRRTEADEPDDCEDSPIEGFPKALIKTDGDYFANSIRHVPPKHQDIQFCGESVKGGRRIWAYSAPCIYQGGLLQAQFSVDVESGVVKMDKGELVQSDAFSKRLEVRWHPRTKQFLLLEGSDPLKVDAGLMRAALIKKYAGDDAKNFYLEEISRGKEFWDLYRRLDGGRLFDVTVNGDLELPSINWALQMPIFEKVRFLGNFNAPQAFFHHSLSFKRCSFVGRINLSSAIVDGDLDIDTCIVRGLVMTDFGRKLRPSIDLYGANIHGNIQLILSEVDGVISANSVTVSGQVLIKGLLQRPRKHDAYRKSTYHQEWILEGMVDFCHAKVESGRIDFSPAVRSAPKYLFNNETNKAIDSLRTQLAGGVILEYCVAKKIDMRGVVIGESWFSQGEGKSIRLTRSSCSMAHAQIDGVVDLNIYLHDDSNLWAGKAFRFQVDILNARAIRAREMMMFGARLGVVELVGANFSLGLRGDAEGAYRLRIDGHLKLNGCKVNFVSLNGAWIGSLKCNHATVGALILRDCAYWSGESDKKKESIDTSKHRYFPVRIGDCALPGKLSRLAIPGDVAAHISDDFWREEAGTAGVALEIQDSRVGGVTMCGAFLVGDCVIRSEITGDLIFWDKEGVRREDEYKERFKRRFIPDSVTFNGPDLPVFNHSSVRIYGSLKLESSRIYRDLDITNLKVFAVPGRGGGNVDLSDVQVDKDLKCRSYWRKGGGHVPLSTECDSISLGMARVGGDCMLTGLKLGEKDETRADNPWIIFQRRLLGLAPPSYTKSSYYNLYAGGLKVGGNLELYTAVAIDKVYSILVEGGVDLSFCEAKTLSLSGDNFETEYQNITLANAKIGCLILLPGYPTYINMTGIKVDEWEVADKDFLTVLDKTYPFDSGNYADVERDLRRSGDELMADEIYRALCEREQDEKLGESLQQARRSRRPHANAAEGRCEVVLPGVVSGIDAKNRDKANLAEFPLVFISSDEWQKLRYEIGGGRNLLLGFLLPLVVWIFIVVLLSVLSIPRPVWIFLGLILFVLGVGYLIDGFKRQGIKAFRVPGRIRRFFGFASVDRGVESVQASSYIFRMAKWVARLSLRPFAGTWLLLMRLATGHLTNTKPLIVVIFMTFLLGLSVFAVPDNFLWQDPEALESGGLDEMPPRGPWGRTSIVLTTAHYVIPLVNLFDVEEIFGQKGFFALRDKAATTFQFYTDIPWVGGVLGGIPKYFFVDWLGCEDLHRRRGGPEGNYKKNELLVDAGGDDRMLRNYDLVQCTGLQPTQFARIISTVNWLTWPLVLLGFAARLRQRKALQ